MWLMISLTCQIQLAEVLPRETNNLMMQCVFSCVNWYLFACSLESAICASKQCQSDILKYTCLCNYDVWVPNPCLEFIDPP